MKIAIDITPISNRYSLRGVGLYTKKLYENLLLFDKENDYLTFNRGEIIPDCDLIHYPYFDPFFITLPVMKKQPHIVTVHDLIPFVFPKNFPRGIKGEIKWQIQKTNLKNSDAIITDSLCSKKDIITFTGIKERKINSIYLGPTMKTGTQVNDKEKQDTIEKFHLPKNFLLYVGDVYPTKNIQRLLKAISDIPKAAGLNCVLVGSAFMDTGLIEKREIDKLIKELSLEKQIIKTGTISEKELFIFYTLASGYIHPSLYEGFGLPVLDAMMLGCPVITSREGSLREITKGYCLECNPYEEKSISNAIDTLLSMDQNSLTQLINDAKKQALTFSWENTAKETVKIYKKIMQ